MTEILAIDIGFGWTKVVAIRNRLLLPSLVGPAEAIRFRVMWLTTTEASPLRSMGSICLWVSRQNCKVPVPDKL